jgi:chitinase
MQLAAALAVLGLVLGTFTGSVTAQSKKSIGYYSGQSLYNDFSPMDIQAQSLTHVNHYYAKIVNGGLVANDPWGDLGMLPSGVKSTAFNGTYWLLNKGLKARYPHLKTTISAGPWSSDFPATVATAESRLVFAKNVTAFLDKHGFDGINLAWRFPASKTDGTNLALLAQTLRQVLGPNKIISAEMHPAAYLSNFDSKLMVDQLDYALLLSYDYVSSQSTVTGHLASMVTTKSGITNLINQGVPASKLIVSMQYTGLNWTNVADNGVHGLGQSGTYASKPTYKSIKAAVASGLYTNYFDEAAMSTYAYSASAKSFITYEDNVSLGKKCDYINQAGLGGAMGWTLAEDIDGEFSWVVAQKFGFKFHAAVVPAPMVTSAAPPAAVSPTASPAVSLVAATTPVAFTQSKKSIGYYSAIALYKDFSPLDIQAESLTHVNFFYANIVNGGLVANDKWGDLGILPSGLKSPAFNGTYWLLNKGLKARYPHLKTTISAGPWSSDFPATVATAESRLVFAKNVTAFLDKHGFDGINLAWRFPASKTDGTNLALLAQTLRQVLGPNKIISAEMHPTAYLSNFDSKLMVDQLDYALLLSYEYYGAQSTVTGHQASVSPS